MLHLHRIGSGQPLVVLPSFSLDHAAMAATVEPVFAELSGWRRIYVDLPGTGGSPPGEPRSDVVLDEVVSTIRAELSNEHFALFGWSYGGYLAAALTRRLAHQVRGLMMVCAAFGIRPEDRDLTGVQPSTPRPGWLDRVPPGLHDHFTLAVGSQRADVAERIADALSRNGPTSEPYQSALRHGGLALSDEAAPTPCDAPVCFLAGQRDRVAGFANLLHELGTYENATFTILSSAGHYLPLEQPAAFASLSKSWLAECGTLLQPNR